MHKSLAMYFWAAIAATVLGAHAIAATIAFQFSGNVTSSIAFSPSLLGETVAGTFGYDLSTPAQSSGATFSDYATGRLSYTVGNNDLIYNEIFSPDTFVSNDSPSGDFILIQTNSSIFPRVSSYITLQDSSSQVFSSTSLPTSLTLAAFDLPNLYYVFDGSINQQLRISITSLTQVSTPEPTTSTLLIFGLLAVGGSRSLRWPHRT